MVLKLLLILFCTVNEIHEIYGETTGSLTMKVDNLAGKLEILEGMVVRLLSENGDLKDRVQNLEATVERCEYESKMKSSDDDENNQSVTVSDIIRGEDVLKPNSGKKKENMSKIQKDFIQTYKRQGQDLEKKGK
jgi:hypothetical protein